MTHANAGFIWCKWAILPAGPVRDVRLEIRDGLIGSVESGVAAQPGDEVHGCLMPGLGNLHSHAFQRGMAGRGGIRGDNPDSFWTWRNVMYEFTASLSPDRVRAIAALAYMEMLECGFTRVGEFHYLHHDRDGKRYDDPAEMSAALVAAASDTGIGLTLLPVFYAHSGFGGAEPQAAQARFVNSLDSYLKLHDGASRHLRSLPDGIVGMAVHSLRAATQDQLAQVLAASQDMPFHIHVAEQELEVSQCLEHFGRRPVEWLLQTFEVDRRWCLVHATHMTRREARDLARSGAVVGLCPITEANLGDGLFPVETYLVARGRFGIGSDSNVRIDATEELRLLEYGQRLHLRKRNVFSRQALRSTGAEMLEMAGEGAADALAGSFAISPGCSADLISLDRSHPSLAVLPDEAIVDGLIFSAGKDAIDCVWRRGRKIVAKGTHVHRDTIVKAYLA